MIFVKKLHYTMMKTCWYCESPMQLSHINKFMERLVFLT